ncbi:MAG: hypothetical protein Tsb0019_06600 [Roseibium sp.]
MEKITATGIISSVMETIDDIHLTGGVRAYLTDGGWSLFPVRDGNTTGSLHPMQLGQLKDFVQKFGLRVFGGDAITNPKSVLPTRIWTPLPKPTEGRRQPADEWGAIAHAADRAGDEKASRLAAHISFSLRAAGIRLRDASDQYHKQLLIALGNGTEIGTRFSNIPLADLYLAFHSLLSEMGSARDYLAAELARRVGAPEKVDSLARFADWVSDPSRASIAAQPAIAAMLEAYSKSSADPWLYHLTDYRNLFLHREPIGSNRFAQLLRLGERATDGLKIPVIELYIHAGPKSKDKCEALDRFVDLHQRLLTLATLVVDTSAYRATPPHIMVVEK